jgi:hypothetical protein
MLESSEWSLSLRFPHQNLVYVSPLPHTRYMSRPFHSSRFYHPKDIGWWVQTLSSSLCIFLHSLFYFVPNVDGRCTCMKCAYSGIIMAREFEILNKTVAVSVCTPQIPHRLAWDWNWASEVTDQWLLLGVYK